VQELVDCFGDALTVLEKRLKGEEMNRVTLTDGSGKWFDKGEAEEFQEKTSWDGRNYISKATGSQWDHQILYRTKGGKWILNSQWQGTRESWEEISNEEAARWLSVNEYESHKACEKEYEELEIK